MRLRAAAVLLLLLLPLAQAQQEDPVTITADEDEVAFSSERPAEIGIKVTRGGPASDTPLDQAASAEVTITIQGVPEGWTASADPNGFSLAPGQSQDVVVTITTTPDAGTEQKDITITAALETADPSGLIQPSGEDSVKVSVTRDEALTRDILETIGPGIWIVLGVTAAAIIVAAYLLVDARRTSIKLTGLGGEVTLKPGQTASIPFQIRNATGGREHVVLSANSPDPEWGVELPSWKLDLEPAGEEEMLVAVTAPKKATAGSRGIVRIVAVPDQRPEKVATLTLTALIEG